MSDTATVICSICSDERKREFVLANHLAGVSINRMETMTRTGIPGIPVIKAETITRHVRNHLPATFQPSQQVAAAPLPGNTVAVSRAARTDVAIARQVEKASNGDDVAREVQQQVLEKLKSGEARVTVQHGLQAQAMLDRREERAKDRALAITLTRMLHTSAAPPEIIDVTPVEERDLIYDGTKIAEAVG